MINEGPWRKVVEYVDCSGTMHLECGHLKGKRPGRAHPQRTRCFTCLPVEERQRLIALRKRQKQLISG